jgi:TatD DNase family protein
MTYIDAHSHLADPRLDEIRAEIISEAQDNGIVQHLQGGVGPEDWSRQLQLAQEYRGLLPVLGLHPYWVAAHNEDLCQQALDLLAPKLRSAYALGEIGLDFRSRICGDDPQARSRQITLFEAQLELAQMAAKPVVLHIVRAVPEALRVLQVWGLPEEGGFVHSFQGGQDEANAYLDLGLKISVGCALTKLQNRALLETVKNIPLSELLIETDSPDQPGERYKGQWNRPVALLDVAQVLAEAKGLTTLEVLDITSANCRKLLQL